LTTLKIGQILKDVFPAGVLSVVTGGNEVGEFLTKHDDVNKISFTGSTRTGKAIQAVASNHLIPVTLELGGNDPAIVLEDADPVKAAAGIYGAGFANCGQICLAVKRVFVHESLYNVVVEELTKLAKAAKVGDGAKEGTTMGPINNKMQFDRVSMLVEDAKKNGATVHSGGAPLTEMGDGYFYPPTILTGVAEGTMIVDEEQFGPVMPVMAFKTVDEAVSRANKTEFGLGGSVWGTDEKKAVEVAMRIEAGNVWVNKHAALLPGIPFGGLKESGVGKQFGKGTMEGCTQAKVIRFPKKVAPAS
jgi:acyl-CoA reductase-like NAD-dependent aldehyde dehydrogenase